MALCQVSYFESNGDETSTPQALGHGEEKTIYIERERERES